VCERENEGVGRVDIGCAIDWDRVRERDRGVERLRVCASRSGERVKKRIFRV
jgi:hypothetical protein